MTDTYMGKPLDYYVRRAAMNPLAAVPHAIEEEVARRLEERRRNGYVAGVKSARAEEEEKKANGHGRDPILHILMHTAQAIQARQNTIVVPDVDGVPKKGPKKLETAATPGPVDFMAGGSFAGGATPYTYTNQKPVAGSFAAVAHTTPTGRFSLTVVPDLMEARISAQSSFADGVRSRDGVHLNPHAGDAPLFAAQGSAAVKSKTKADFSNAAYGAQLPGAVPQVTFPARKQDRVIVMDQPVFSLTDEPKPSFFH